jgi:hypothetical protein
MWRQRCRIVAMQNGGMAAKLLAATFAADGIMDNDRCS